jgi:DNA-directed RNA polymerase specialized sigma24 family protein
MLGRILHWPLTVGSRAMAESNDEEIVSGLQHRNPDSIAKLYDCYGGQVYGLILDTVESRCIADDLLVQTFLRVWTRAGRNNPQHTGLFPWLKSLAMSCAADYLQYRGTWKG